MKASFLLSFATHIALIAFLFSAPVTLWQASEETLSVINVNLVTDISPSLPPKKKIPSSAKISEKSSPATTKLALFNPSQTPLKHNKKKPQTLIAPPPPSLDTPPPSPHAKTTTKKTKTPKRPPQKKTKKKTPKAQKIPTKKITQKPKKQQPEAAPPDTPTKEKLSLESILKSLQKRDNSALTAKKTKKALAKITSDEPSPSPSSSSSSSTEKPRFAPSDLTRLKNQLSSCWTILSTESAINHTVKVRIRFDENFRVIDIELPEKKQKGHIPGYLVAADQARSAIMHPSCQPLDLPRDKISSSDPLILNFNPQAMTGSLY